MHDKFHDSAGVPWQGREFSGNSWSEDFGEEPLEITQALSGVLDKQNLFRAISASRLLVPLIAELGEGEIGPHGQRVDKSAELGIVAVATPDAKSAIPVFSSVSEMATWNKNARPVPIEASKIALAAITEGHHRIVLNPASRALVVRRPALAAIAQGQDWLPPYHNQEVLEICQKAAVDLPHLATIKLFDSDPEMQLAGPELQIELGLEKGLSPESLRDLLLNYSTRLQSQRFLSLVETFSLKIVDR